MLVVVTVIACGGEPTAGPQPTHGPPPSAGDVEDTRPIRALRPDAEPLAAAVRDLCTVVSRIVRPDGSLDLEERGAAEFEAMRERHGPVLDELDRDPRMRGRPSYPTLVAVLRERGVVFECPAFATLLRAMDEPAGDTLPRRNGN